MEQAPVSPGRGLERIDWSRPWLEPLAGIGPRLVLASDWKLEANTLAAAGRLSNHAGLPIRFSPQAALPAKLAYEAFISETGEIPSRDNLHDFFNALIWLAFPRTKRSLNALQAAEIHAAQRSESKGVPPARGRLRDALTIFDESAALVAVSHAKYRQALRDHRWEQLFLDDRAAFGTAWEVRLFGHALLEKLTAPFKAITAHCVIVEVDAAYFSLPVGRKIALLDEMLAIHLSENFSTAEFSPLPVLGIPGWWPGQDASFYADKRVFRPRRHDGGKSSGA